MTTTHRISTVILLIASITAMTLPAAADNNGGSGYSRYGIGDIRYFPSGQASGMGGTSIAYLSTDEINRLNPAAWARINRTRFSVGVLYEGFSTTDGVSSSYLSGTTFNGAAISLPVLPQSGVVFSFGLQPYSRVNYNVRSHDTSGTYSYDMQYIGNGGLSTAWLGLSASPGSTLNLGVRMDYTFGSLKYLTKQTFTAGAYTNSSVERSLEMHGIGVTFGAVYTGLKSLLNLPPTNMLSVGAVISTGTNLSGTLERIYLYNTGTVTSHDTVDTPGGTSKIPFSLGGGIAYGTDRYTVAADAYYQQWSNATIADTSMSFLRNSIRLGAGIEFLPSREMGASGFQRWRWRLGTYYNSTYYRYAGEPLNETGVTGGMGIPIVGDTRLNVGLEYGFRGTTDNQLQKDKILRISLTISGGELWFVRPPEE